MKDLKTITEKDLLYAAYYHLSEIWHREEELNDGYRKLHNEDSEIFQQRTAKLKKQLEEINDRILEIEHAE